VGVVGVVGVIVFVGVHAGIVQPWTECRVKPCFETSSRVQRVFETTDHGIVRQ
jgi:hypothetical protein